MSPYSYIRNIFRADAAKNGGIVRRKIENVNRIATHNALLQEVKDRGFHLIEAGDQYIIVCRSGTFKLHC